MDLWMRRLNEHGLRSYWLYDVLYGIDNFVRLAKEYGSQVVGTVFYTISPVHSDEYLAAKAAEIAAVPEIDGVLFYDTAGVLELERLRALLPKIVAAAAPKPVEIHANNLMGTSGLTYVGWPVMATPLSQLVGTQAVLNVSAASATGSSPIRSSPTSPAITASRRRRSTPR
jgi:pyruvate/oxaloacetate carboxyltransferase